MHLQKCLTFGVHIIFDVQSHNAGIHEIPAACGTTRMNPLIRTIVNILDIRKKSLAEILQKASRAASLRRTYGMNRRRK